VLHFSNKSESDCPSLTTGFTLPISGGTWSFGDAVGLGEEMTVEGNGLHGSGLAWSQDRPAVDLAAFV
jgi:hypothetical protein